MSLDRSLTRRGTTAALTVLMAAALGAARTGAAGADTAAPQTRQIASSACCVCLAVPGLRPLLLLTWLPPTPVVAPEALAAPYADQLGGGSTATGLLLGAAPAGSVLGEILAGTLLRPSVRVRLVLPLGGLMFVPLTS